MAEFELDTTKKINEIYTKIALWHNGEKEEPNKTSLVLLSQDIVEDIIKFTIKDLNAKTKSGVRMDNEEAKKEFLKKIQEENPKDKKRRFFDFLKK